MCFCCYFVVCVLYVISLVGDFAANRVDELCVCQPFYNLLFNVFVGFDLLAITMLLFVRLRLAFCVCLMFVVVC